MKSFLLSLLFSLSLAAESAPWNVTLGDIQGPAGTAYCICSSGDILSLQWTQANGPVQREVTGFVNQEQLDILERMMMDPKLVELQSVGRGEQLREVKVHYGKLQKTFRVAQKSLFPEPIERLAKELERALRAAKL